MSADTALRLSQHTEQTAAVIGKGSPYTITDHRVPELIPVLGSQPAGDVSRYQFCYLVNRGMMGVYSLPKTVTRQRRGCDLNPGASVPESSTLTTRLWATEPPVATVLTA